MSVRKITPCIHLNGAAGKATRLYESALNAKVENIVRYGDIPGTDAGAGNRNLVLHAQLRIDEDTVMLSDTTPQEPVPTEGNVQIALDFTGVAEMTKAFDALTAGGKVLVPMNDTFWGAKFGILTDAYGVRWMFNCQLPKAEG